VCERERERERERWNTSLNLPTESSRRKEKRWEDPKSNGILALSLIEG